MKQYNLDNVYISLGYYKYLKEDPMFNHTKFPDIYTDSIEEASYKCYWSLSMNSKYICMQKENIEEFENSNIVIIPNNKMIFGDNIDIPVYEEFKNILQTADYFTLINEDNFHDMVKELNKIYHNIENAQTRKRKI